MRDALLIHGMHGLGDNLHQRAVIRQLMNRHDIWLETPWPCVFHDMVGPHLRLLDKGSRLRTQNKNAFRERAAFSRVVVPPGAKELKVWYRQEDVKKYGFLGAMMDYCGCATETADFRLPIPVSWRSKAAALLNGLDPGKPIMIYRPLVERTEWNGCASRNSDHAAYADLLASIRDRFFVVSVADLVPGQEWIVSRAIEADATYHAGELDFETLAALTARAALMFCSPGFAIALSQAVGTPTVCIFGGHENSRHYIDGARFAPFLGIDPIEPCECFSKNHKCRKAIDMPVALRKLREFVDAAAGRDTILARYPADRLGGVAAAVHESGGTRSLDRVAAQC